MVMTLIDYPHHILAPVPLSTTLSVLKRVLKNLPQKCHSCQNCLAAPCSKECCTSLKKPHQIFPKKAPVFQATKTKEIICHLVLAYSNLY